MSIATACARSCAAALITVLACAGEAAPPILSLTMPDLARTRTRLAAGPFKNLWDLPALQRLRTALPANEFDPLWWTVAERAQEVRATLVPGRTASDEPGITCGIRLPAGPQPALPGTPNRREGDWWLVGNREGAAAPPSTPGDAQADMRLLIDLLAAREGMTPAQATSYQAVLGQLGLSRIEVLVTATAQGFHDLVRLPGCTLPLRPLDRAAFAGIPATVASVMAIGIDGAGLERLMRGLLADVPGGWAGADADAGKEMGIGLGQLLTSCDGTIVLVATPGVPVPGLTLTVPANAQVDAVVAALLERVAPGQAARMVQEARQQSVLLPSGRGMPLLFSLRRSATRWIVSSDPVLVETLGANAAETVPASAWMPPAGALAHAFIDNRTYLQLLAGSMGMANAARGASREQIAVTSGIQQTLSAAAGLMPPSLLTVTRDSSGLRAEGDNNVVGPAPIGAGMLLPAIMLVRESARKATAGSNLRQIALAMLAYGSENNDAWPKSLEQTKQWADGELSDKIFQYPGRPDHVAPILYVRPHPAAKAIQPVLITDPACQRGKGSIVCYADGHIASVKGTALWEEGKRLAALPKAAHEGIAFADWAAINTETGLPVAPKP